MHDGESGSHRGAAMTRRFVVRKCELCQLSAVPSKLARVSQQAASGEKRGARYKNSRSNAYGSSNQMRAAHSLFADTPGRVRFSCLMIKRAGLR